MRKWAEDFLTLKNKSVTIKGIGGVRGGTRVPLSAAFWDRQLDRKAREKEKKPNHTPQKWDTSVTACIHLSEWMGGLKSWLANQGQRPLGKHVERLSAVWAELTTGVWRSTRCFWFLGRFRIHAWWFIVEMPEGPDKHWAGLWCCRHTLWYWMVNGSVSREKCTGGGLDLKTDEVRLFRGKTPRKI